jgi:hypothetical protein
MPSSVIPVAADVVVGTSPLVSNVPQRPMTIAVSAASAARLPQLSVRGLIRRLCDMLSTRRLAILASLALVSAYMYVYM